MKNILFIIILTLTSLVRSQITSNIVTETEFNNIKINNIPLTDIIATEGNQTQLRDLIPVVIQKSNIDSDGEFYNYTYDGFEIGFSRNLSTIEHPILSGFEITKNNWNLTIQGITITIGDSISTLGNVVFNKQSNGSKSVVYQYCDGCNNFLSLYLDPNNLITKIIYIEQT